MDVLFGMIIISLSLLFSVFKEIYVGYSLGLACLMFGYISWRRGFSVNSISNMLIRGGRKGLLVLQIFILIGLITSIWMASGTVPGIVYYGINFIKPNYFIVSAFLISLLVTFLMGSPFGSIGTIGIALIAMAKGGNVDLNIVGGAIISGAFFGDRISPMAASTNLVANLTRTDLFTNIRNMVRSTIVPLILSLILYTYFSYKEPLNILGTTIDRDILNTFNISWIVLLPAFIIIVFSIFKIDVKISMLASIIVSFVIAVLVQKYRLDELVGFLIWGFSLDKKDPLYGIITGGGLFSMAKSGIVVYLSCALSGIFQETNMLASVEKMFSRAKDHGELFAYTIIVSILTAAFGFSQIISIVLSEQLMARTYEDKKLSRYDLALDLENTAVVLSALIPWSISAFVPTTTMDISMAGFIPYAFFLYLLPITSFIGLKLDMRKKLKLKK